MTSRSPKRKREHALPLDTKRPVKGLVFDPEGEDSSDASPRTKTARRFEHLQIDSRPSSHWSPEVGSKANPNIPDHPGLLRPDAREGVEAPVQDTGSEAQKRPESASGASLDTTSAARAPDVSRSRSPPLSSEDSESFWRDCEITGHNPDDPDDDGYGINGIGFRPTAAIAWSRSQRRKQQLSDYRNREAREARQYRSERRKRFMDDGDDAASTESSPRKSIRVHFEDG
ncbi:hypothetical protein A1O1_02124 [Capronia coronata CBS 617.96]|uniref:Uncharacterized protein n=1 Tax=Capronia coronata CBS 617.96 TaxID=1182541 RepID=W9YWR9_9EURO|nr:uncharacterized protein A1O1_02124 [Capronia coronata CBS 617.96]EXJ93731.1 hypothetical protein A1O1_02124 [Capronia coronata CBS 617.96]